MPTNTIGETGLELTVTIELCPLGAPLVRGMTLCGRSLPVEHAEQIWQLLTGAEQDKLAIEAELLGEPDSENDEWHSEDSRMPVAV